MPIKITRRLNKRRLPVPLKVLTREELETKKMILARSLTFKRRRLRRNAMKMRNLTS